MTDKDKTTIQVSKSTLDKLNTRKYKLQAKYNKSMSLEDVIEMLLKNG